MAQLSNEAKEARNAYHREWYAANKEKARKYNREWYAANRDKVKTSQARYWERRAQREKENAEG